MLQTKLDRINLGPKDQDLAASQEDNQAVVSKMDSKASDLEADHPTEHLVVTP
jgi:hypothetical protein